MNIAINAEQQHEMAILNGSGDTKVKWDPSKPDEVAAARAMFDGMKAKGYIAFRNKTDQQAGQRMDTFDPTAKSLIMVPRLQGG